MGFNLIYWTPMSDLYFLYVSITEECRNFWKKHSFSRRKWPYCGNTIQVNITGLGSIGLRNKNLTEKY